MTEFLSLIRWLDFWSLLAAWGIVLLTLLLILSFGNQKHFDVNLNRPLHNISRFELSLLVCLFLIVVAIGVIAWVAPPNNWDSMTYHMSRVMHWIQNKSVAYYPTSILRQLHSNPWSEFAILHFQILSDGDHFANFVQWFSMLGSLVGVSLLAKELKADLRGQIFAAVFCATIPMGILQGSSTQNDYVVSFWLVCFVYFAMLLRTKPNLLYAMGTGAALGLAILTKGTAYLFALPFLAWLGLSSFKGRRVKNLLLLGLALMLSFILNLGHYARNYNLYHSPLGPGQEEGGYVYANEVFNFSAVASNLMRNVGLHAGTPFRRLNVALHDVLSLLHRLIGNSPNDIRTTWKGEKFHIGYSLHEDIAGNPIHLFLIIASMLLYVLQRHKEQEVSLYILSIIMAFLLFCVYLKWQPWHSRLHLPLFIMCAPFVGLMISRIRYHGIVNLSVALLIIMALPWICYNESRPILGKNSIFIKNRMEQYFKNNPSLAHPYTDAAQVLADLPCSDIGLIIGGDDWEYPLWVLLRDKKKAMVRLEHVNVTNISQRKHDKYRLGTLSPCAIFAVNANPLGSISIGNIIYLRKWSYDSVSVYTRTPSP